MMQMMLHCAILWYKVYSDHCITTAVIHHDLQALHKWGLDNKTTFEPEKVCDGDLPKEETF